MKRLAPYLLILPGGLWLVIFFVVPMVVMLSLSLQAGRHRRTASSRRSHWQNYARRARRNYQTSSCGRCRYGAGRDGRAASRSPTRSRTGSPSRAARRKSTYLFLLLLPFFVSFVLRTISWQFLLADDGIAARHR